MAHPIKHFRTITRHRHKVIANCARAGILRQGLIHDLSKYSPTEFIPVQSIFRAREVPMKRKENCTAIHRRGCITRAETVIITNTGTITTQRQSRLKMLKCL